MILTNDYTRVAAVFMNPGEAMELLGIKGSGDFEKDKDLMRRLVMKYHPDRVGESREMLAVNSLLESYIRQGKPLPTVIPQREPDVRYHSYDSYGPYPSYSQPRGPSRSDQEFNDRAQDWWERYAVTLPSVVDEFIDKGEELFGIIQEGDRDNIISASYSLEESLYDLDEYIKNNATLKPNGELIRDARSMLLKFDRDRGYITDIRSIWSGAGSVEDIGNLISRSMGLINKFDEMVRMTKDTAVVIARRHGYDTSKSAPKTEVLM